MMVPLLVTVGGSQFCSRLCVLDRKSGFRFLVDSAASVSVLPKNKNIHKISKDCILDAAIGTRTYTYDFKLLTFDFGLCREISWSFMIADVSPPILGIDFLEN